MNIKNHFLENIKIAESPNFDTRPQDKELSLIVLHSISLPPTIFGNNYVEDFFLNKLSKNDSEYINSIKKYEGFFTFIYKKNW